MVSLRLVLYNLLKIRRNAGCPVQIGKGLIGEPYIIAGDKTGYVKIGNYCSIAHGVILIAHFGHLPPKGLEEYRVATYPVRRVLRHRYLPSYYLQDPRNFIVIGNDVTIGANAIILPGVKIGDSAIIGAGAVVSHDIPPYAIAAGVPAKVLKYRYSAEQIRKLLRIAWWNWDEKKIYDNMDYFYGKVNAFIEKFHEETER
jgi:virginiamycin A acetyltransferase